MIDDTNSQSQMPEGKELFAFIAEHPGVWLPGLYLLGSTIGMLDSWWFFRQFRVNVFLYSDLSDFLLASFREPAAWLVIAWCTAIGAWDYWRSVRASRSTSTRRWLRWYGTRRYRQVGLAFAVIIAAVYIASFASWRANNIHEGRSGQTVRVRLASDAAAEEPAILLGGTIGFLFLYDRDRRTVSIHPYENVLAIDTAAPR